MSESLRHTRRAALVLLAAGLLGGCGKKGAILPPEGQESAYQRNVYPEPASVVPGGKAGLGPPAPVLYEDEFGRKRYTTSTIQSE
jgi:hypothetical protein